MISNANEMENGMEKLVKFTLYLQYFTLIGNQYKLRNISLLSNPATIMLNHISCESSALTGS
jgi:hypothetical protein